MRKEMVLTIFIALFYDCKHAPAGFEVNDKNEWWTFLIKKIRKNFFK